MYVVDSQGTDPKKRRVEEETTLVDDVVGTTIEDPRVVRRGDKWSFGRGGVFIGGGVSTCKVIRHPLQFMISMDWGIIQIKGRDGHLDIMYPGVHDWEHGMFLADDDKKKE